LDYCVILRAESLFACDEVNLACGEGKKEIQAWLFSAL